MYKDKEKQKETDRERQRRYRKGVTKGVTLNTAQQEIIDHINKDDVIEVNGVIVKKSLPCTPDIIDKLTDPRWRTHLEKVCSAFKVSSNPSYSKDVWLGDTNLSIVCDWLECTNKGH